jgi:hypothetical protein
MIMTHDSNSISTTKQQPTKQQHQQHIQTTPKSNSSSNNNNNNNGTKKDNAKTKKCTESNYIGGMIAAADQLRAEWEPSHPLF